MNKNNIKFISMSIGLIIIVLLVVCIFPNTFSKFSNNKVLNGSIKVNNTISNYLINTNDLEKDNNNYIYKTDSNNYIKIDNNLYQIMGIFNNNIKVIDTNTIDINELDEFYNNLSDNTKKIIIESDYYDENNTIKRKVYIPDKYDYSNCPWIDKNIIKPVFYIDGNINYIEGNGSKNNPYIV